MTKRDAQAREYAAESYEKTPAKQGVSDTFDLLSDAMEFLLEMATRRPGRTHYEGCRKDHVECLVAALVNAVTRLRDATRSLADQDATLSVSGGNVTVTMDATLTDDEREAIEWFAEVRKPLTRLTQSHNREKYKDTLCELLERLK
jgi:hypothetical protein